MYCEEYGRLFYVFITDITEKKENLSLVNEQLKLALAEAEQANVAKTAFFPV